MENKVKYWQELSDYDLETAQAMNNTGRLLYVGFMAHQSLEKILKACYVKLRDSTPPFSHSLSFLAKESGINEHLSEEQNDFLDLLEPMNIEARYPTRKESLLKALTTERCDFILTKTRELQTWIKKQL